MTHLFCAYDGGLYDCRHANWSRRAPLRPVYMRHFPTIATTAELKASLRAGAHVWPGGYALAFVTSDGEVLSFKAVRENLALVLRSIIHQVDDGWRVVGILNVGILNAAGCDDARMWCAHTGEKIV